MILNAKSVLLVEDNPSDVGLTRRALEKRRIGCDLIVAEDGQEAVDYLWGTGVHSSRDTSALPAVILLDLNLPRVPGLEVLRRIRGDAHIHRLPVVILTTSNEGQDVCTGYDLGVNSYIRKPVDFQQFEIAITQITSYWLSLNQAPPELACVDSA